jgi:microcystin-dependent protein
MGQPYIGEIRLVGFSFAPVGWAFCDGSLIPISENDALFTLIGTTYGGDGQNTFALPDLRGRIPLHVGPNVAGPLGSQAGTESVTLNTQQIPIHSHPVLAANAIGGAKSPQNNFLASTTTINLYSGDNPDQTFALPSGTTPSGGNQPHDNMQPYLCISFIISLFGIFPNQG